jgi:hypothetical protein
MRRGTRWGSRVLPVAVALLAALILPAAASAAVTKPGATTRGASPIGQTTATVHGTVNAHGAATTYFFQYGIKGSAYSAQTAVGSAGSGTAAHAFTGAISLLAPATSYHYRIVATNAKGTTRGKDRTFKTKRQPLGVSLGGIPNPVRTGASTILAGVLSGTGNANRQVVLQANPWPYTQGFLPVANNQVTDASGKFAFPILAVNVNTQYKVLMPAKPEVQSPIVLLGTKVRVTTHVHVTRGTHSGRVRFTGSLLPAMDGTQILIQKFVDDKWTNIGSTSARHVSGSRSAYRKTVTQRHPGRYRVLHNAPEPHVPNIGKTVRVHHVRR